MNLLEKKLEVSGGSVVIERIEMTGAIWLRYYDWKDQRLLSQMLEPKKGSGERQVVLGAISHGLTQLYLYLKHNLVSCVYDHEYNSFIQQRAVVLSELKELGIIYNGSEWWSKLEQSHFRLALTQDFPEGVKVTTVLTAAPMLHRAVYTLSRDYNPAGKQKDVSVPELWCANLKAECHFKPDERPTSTDEVFSKFGNLLPLLQGSQND